MATEMAALHDDCLQYEMEVLGSVEELGKLRNRFSRQGNLQKNIRFILPVLNAIIADAEAYKEFIEEYLKE